MSSIGERIKEVRKQTGLNQKKFAIELGISQNHVSNIENDNENPSATLLKLLCLKFNIAEQWLIEGSGTPMPSFDIVSDEGLLSKYNTMRTMLEQLMQDRSGEDLKNTVESFSFFVSLLSISRLTSENTTAYLRTVCDCVSLIEQQEFLTQDLGNYGKLGKNSYEMLLRYKTESEKRLAQINKQIREMNNIYLRQLQADTEL